MDKILDHVEAVAQSILLTRCARSALAAYDLGPSVDILVDVTLEADVTLTLLVDHVRRDERWIDGVVVREILTAWMETGCAVRVSDIVEREAHALTGNAARLAAVEPAS